MKKFLYLGAFLISISLLTACGGSNSPQKEAGQPAGAQGQAAQIPPVGKPVVEVPDAVKGKWKGVVLFIKDKDKSSVKEQPVNLGEKYRLPGSDLTIQVKEFFPSFVMQGSSITSTSNDANNPAAQIVIMEGGSEIFNGWLFGRFPSTHAFSHPKYAITLKEGIPRK